MAYAGILAGMDCSLLPAQFTMVPSHVHSGGHSASMIHAPASFVLSSSDPAKPERGHYDYGCVMILF